MQQRPNEEENNDSYIKQGFMATEEIFNLHQDLAGEFAWIITRANNHGGNAYPDDIAKIRKTIFKLYFLVSKDMDETKDFKDLDIVKVTNDYTKIIEFIPKFLKSEVFSEVLDIKKANETLEDEFESEF